VPFISSSTYRPPRFLSNPHVQTVFASMFRKVSGVRYKRDRIDTPDGDFLDLDWSGVGADKVAIILHGLEGNSERSYVKGMVRALNNDGWDAVAMNFRGCSGEINRKLRFYHSGETEDLDTVVSHVIAENKYSRLALIGFSLGGNVVLKYLGERGSKAHPVIRRGVAISAPCDLTAGANKMAEPVNRLYIMRFLRMLREKIRMKMELMPERINDDGYRTIKTFKEFDDLYTAPMHGFKDAADYWQKASSKPFLPEISVPTLLVNAADDPFLAEPCYPVDEAKANSAFFLEVPKFGGHAGFVAFNREKVYWSESRAISFLNT